MAYASHFETLPIPIIERIIFFLAENARNHYYGIGRYSEEQRMTRLPLLDIGGRWQQIATVQLCTICRIQLLSDGAFEEELLSWPEYAAQPQPSSYRHIVKELLLETNYQSILDGGAVKAIRSSKALFPSTKLLRLSFVSFINEKVGNIEEANVNALRFVRQVKQMVPDINRISIVCNQLQQGPIGAEVPLGHLLTGLYCLVSGISFKSNVGPFSSVIGTAGIVGLTQINYVWNSSSMLYTQIIRNNAKTLKTITIKSTRSSDIPSIMSDDNGNAIEYPCVRQLRLDLARLSGDIVWDSAQTTSFPGLVNLGIIGRYPFIDDMLLRGCSMSLEYLELTATAVTLTMLCKAGAMSPGYFKCLNHLKLIKMGTMPTEEVLFHNALEMSPTLQSLEYCTWTNIARNPTSFVSIPTCSSLQLLLLPSVMVGLSQIFKLVQALPLLTDLHIQVFDMDICPEDKKVNLPDYVYKTFYPLSHNFKCLVPVTGGFITLKNLAFCSMLLAIACPNYSYTALHWSNVGDHDILIRNYVRTGSYKKYSSKLKGLLFSSW